MSYNKKRHILLIQDSQNLENEGKSIYYENREAFFELLKYDIQVESHIFWQNRAQFFSIINDFLDGTIDGQRFREEFFYINRENNSLYEEFTRDLKNLETFEPDLRSKDFCDVIGRIFTACDFFEIDEEDDEEKRELNKKLLKNFVQNAFLEMQKYL